MKRTDEGEWNMIVDLAVVNQWPLLASCLGPVDTATCFIAFPFLPTANVRNYHGLIFEDANGCPACTAKEDPIYKNCNGCHSPIQGVDLSVCEACDGKDFFCMGGFCKTCIEDCPVDNCGSKCGPGCLQVLTLTCSGGNRLCPNCVGDFLCSEEGGGCCKWWCPDDQCDCGHSWGFTCSDCGEQICENCDCSCQDEESSEDEENSD